MAISLEGDFIPLELLVPPPAPPPPPDEKDKENAKDKLRKEAALLRDVDYAISVGQRDDVNADITKLLILRENLVNSCNRLAGIINDP